MSNTGMTDVCFGPIAIGQFFIDRMNPQTPITYKVVGVLIEGVFICEMWGMNEDHWIWHFGRFENGGGLQIAECNLRNMERVSGIQARHAAEQELRRRDDEWRATWQPDREPIKITRCSCGVGDHAEVTRHTVGCFMRGEVR